MNDLLDALDFNQVVIFVKSVSRAAELNKLLVECNFPSICIHSGMSQEERFVILIVFDVRNIVQAVSSIYFLILDFCKLIFILSNVAHFVVQNFLVDFPHIKM